MTAIKVAWREGNDRSGLLSVSGVKLKVTKGLGSWINKCIPKIRSMEIGIPKIISKKAFFSAALPLIARIKVSSIVI